MASDVISILVRDWTSRIVPVNHCILLLFAGVLGDGALNDSGWSKTAIFSAFGRYIFGTFRDKAKIIMHYIERYDVVLRRLSTNPNMTLNDLQWLFYVIFFSQVRLEFCCVDFENKRVKLIKTDSHYQRQNVQQGL